MEKALKRLAHSGSREQDGVEGKGSGGGHGYCCCSRSQVRRGRERDVDGQGEVPTKRGFLSFLKEGLE